MTIAATAAITRAEPGCMAKAAATQTQTISMNNRASDCPII